MEMYLDSTWSHTDTERRNLIECNWGYLYQNITSTFVQTEPPVSRKYDCLDLKRTLRICSVSNGKWGGGGVDKKSPKRKEVEEECFCGHVWHFFLILLN